MVNVKFEAFCGDQRLEQGLINMLQMKMYIYCKTLSNHTRIQKAHLKVKNREHLILLIEKIYSSNKNMRVNCAPVTVIAK